MARLFLTPVRRKILFITLCAVPALCLDTTLARSQGTHAPPGAGARMAPPPRPFIPPVTRPAFSTPIPAPRFLPAVPASRPPRFGFVPPFSRSFVPHPRVVPDPRLTGISAPFLFPQHKIFLPHRFRFGQPFFGAQFFPGGIGGIGLGFTTWWMPNCSPYWTFGYYCTGLPPVSSPFANYFTLQPYEPPVYSYTPEGQPLVWLYLKNGTIYSVTDYWFTNGQLHFIAIEETGAKSAEQAINSNDLDVQKTLDVNTSRGFRVVMRDEPLDQYMRDRPNTIPPLLQSTTNQ